MKYLVIAVMLLLSGCVNSHIDMPKSTKVNGKNGKYPITACNKELRDSLELDKANLIDEIRVYKASRSMELYKDGKVVYRFKVSLGKNPKGHKLKQGDFKTPIGRYKIVGKKCDSKYFRSISISYPDKEDIDRGRKNGVNVGAGITIHAQPLWNSDGHGDSYTLTQDWTNGCIALTNGAMEILWRVLKIKTPITIYP
ncbi:ErfK/YbiS/YcfS/YnhG family protein [hydrothermal vent metagenome]|uniref:ErfK/YbiS/YcfS/YnhG family protein n=1 Tax=hydrothermal vent metagenome TaxID=652676 RepID=A0A1W1EJN9_9ZZZZ